MKYSAAIEDRVLLSAVERNAVTRSVAEAKGLPNRAYTSEAFAERERDTLLANTWTCIGFASELPTPGAAMPVELLGLPLLALRAADGAINVFHNVCSHRGQKLLSKPCKIQGALRCPYHSWTYGLDGRLRGTPHLGGSGVHELDGFDRSKHGLKPIRSAVWLDLIFVNLSGNAPSLDEHLQPLLDRWRPFWGEKGAECLQPVDADSRLQLEVNANWKLAVENYCESYHLPWIHPGLNSYSRLEDHYNIIGAAHFSGQGSMAYNFSNVANIQLPRFPSWPEERVKEAEYVALFPNVLLGLQCDQFFAIALQPVAHDRTIEHLQIYYVGEESASTDFEVARAKTKSGWREVFAEDVGVVEGMQRGRHSPAFQGGVFSPVMDTSTHHFHRWAASGLAEAPQQMRVA